MSINTSMMQNFGLEDLSHVQSRRNLLKYLVRVEMASDWLTRIYRSILAEEINIQNRDMACKLGCGLFLSPQLLYIKLSSSFLIGRKRTVNFQNQRPWRHNCRLYNYHVKDCQGHGLSYHVWPQCMISKSNHVKFARFVCLAVSEEAKTWLPFILFNV